MFLVISLAEARLRFLGMLRPVSALCRLLSLGLWKERRISLCRERSARLKPDIGVSSNVASTAVDIRGIVRWLEWSCYFIYTLC